MAEMTLTKEKLYMLGYFQELGIPKTKKSDANYYMIGSREEEQS